MSGNKFFRPAPTLFRSSQEYNNTAHLLNKNSKDSVVEFDFEKEWEKLTDKMFSEKRSENTTDLQENELIKKKDTSLLENKQEIRMQEIEDYILENVIVRIINGNLCMWNGSYYKQLDLKLFTEEVRRVLPRASQRKIARFSRFKEAYEYMQANVDIQQFSEGDIARAQNMIVFRNVIYEGRTRSLLEKEPCYPIVFGINAKYLKSGNLSTPCFDRIINQATGNDENTLKLCYQILGYIFSQGNEAKKFFVFGTAPDSGKSIIGEFIAKMLGADNVSTIALSDFGGRFTLGTINQKVLNYNMDLPATELDRDSIQRLKQLTGDPRIECEVKYVQGKTAMHHCKFLFATNHPIKLKYEDSAFFNRLVLVPFMYSVDEQKRDYDLPHKLWEERNAIATKAAHAYSELLKNNFVFQKSALADSILCDWKEQDDGEILRYFFRDIFEIADKDSFIPTETIFKMYQEYCEIQGLPPLYVEKNQFSRRFHSVTRLETTKRRVEGFSSPVNGYLGVRVRKE